MDMIINDEYFMKQALKEATLAFEKGEVPVGAVIVSKTKIIARAHNQTELLKDVTAHAEILAITAAANHLGSKYLQECTLYVTLEPCVMCAGAIFWAQLERLVFGAEDDKRGFMQYGKHLIHPKCIIESGVLPDESSRLLKSFFQAKRDGYEP
jgi:tRNA(adenine34) deaminase